MLVENNQLGYDPKLKEAAAEIKAILRKHDIGGYVSLASQTHSEFFLEITPTWSCVTWDNNSDGSSTVRFRAKATEIGQELVQKMVGETCHLIFQIRDLCAMGFGFTEKMIEKIQTEVDVEHTPYVGFRPHREN